MTTVDLLAHTFKTELGMTRRILAAVPDDKPDWQPHPKSMSLGKLALHVATLPRMAVVCLTTDHFDVGTSNLNPILESQGQLLTTFDQAAADALATLERTNDGYLAENWKFHFGDRILSDESRAATLLHFFLGHLIHHRAQLGTYLRALDLPVPGVYGPSADDKLARASNPD